MSDIALYDAELEYKLTKLDLHTYLELAKMNISYMEDEYSEIYMEESKTPNKSDDKISKMESLKNDLIEMIDAVKERNSKVLESLKNTEDNIKDLTDEEKQKAKQEESDAVVAIRKILDENIAERDELLSHAVRTPDGKINQEYVDKYLKHVNERRKKIKEKINKSAITTGSVLGRVMASNMVNKDQEKIRTAIDHNFRFSEKYKRLKNDAEEEKHNNVLAKKNNPDAIDVVVAQKEFDDFTKKLSFTKKISAYSLLLDKDVVDSVYRACRNGNSARLRAAHDANKRLNK